VYARFAYFIYIYNESLNVKREILINVKYKLNLLFSFFFGLSISGNYIRNQ
jgi:hypothetical protein